MPPKSTASETEERILVAATALFAASDYASVKVPQVAARARVGLGTLYQHFPSKEALGNAVFRRCKRAWLSATLDKWPQDEAPAIQFDVYWRLLCRYAELDRHIAVYNERHPLGHDFDAESQALRDEIDRRVAKVLRSWIASKQVKDLPLEVMKALIHGTFHRILELPVSKRKRAILFERAGIALWDALATEAAVAGKSPRRAAAAPNERRAAV